jgi:hypothetical protein
MADYFETMTLPDALRDLKARERDVLNMIRNIRRASYVESSTFWTNVAQSHFTEGFKAMSRALHYPGEDD